MSLYRIKPVVSHREKHTIQWMRYKLNVPTHLNAHRSVKLVAVADNLKLARQVSEVPQINAHGRKVI